MDKSRTYSSSEKSGPLYWNPLKKESFQLSKEDAHSSHHVLLPSGTRDESDPLLSNGTTNSQTGMGANWIMTAFLIINTALGIGLLNFPASYFQAGGILSATLIQVVTVILMMTTMLILAYCSDYRGDNTYHDVLLSMCGRRAQHLAAISITCTLYCVCIAVFVIIGDQMDSLFLSIFGRSFCSIWYLERHFTITVIAFLILPMCYCKRVDFLQYLGPIGIFAMLYPVFLTVYGYFTVTDKPKDIVTSPQDWSSVFAMIPVLGLGYQCQEVVVPIYACMRERNLWNFTKSSILAMGVLMIIYSVTGCFGFITFGNGVAHNVMTMFNAEDPVVMIGVGALTLKMIVTYPIMALCGRDAVIGLYAELTGVTNKEFERHEKIRRFVVASIWFGSSLMLALVTDGLGVVIKYLGCVTSANIYVYPGICLLRVAMKEDPSYGHVRSRLMLALGVFITAFGVFCIAMILTKTIMTPETEKATSACS